MKDAGETPSRQQEEKQRAREVKGREGMSTSLTYISRTAIAQMV
jgi:hypothetical protein